MIKFVIARNLKSGKGWLKLDHYLSNDRIQANKVLGPYIYFVCYLSKLMR